MEAGKIVNAFNTRTLILVVNCEEKESGMNVMKVN